MSHKIWMTGYWNFRFQLHLESNFSKPNFEETTEYYKMCTSDFTGLIFFQLSPVNKSLNHWLSTWGQEPQRVSRVNFVSPDGCGKKKKITYFMLGNRWWVCMQMSSDWMHTKKKKNFFFSILALSGCSNLKVKAMGGGSPEHNLIFLAGLWIKMVKHHLYELNYYVKTLLNISCSAVGFSCSFSALNFKASHHVKISNSKKNHDSKLPWKNTHYVWIWLVLSVRPSDYFALKHQKV